MDVKYALIFAWREAGRVYIQMWSMIFKKTRVYLFGERVEIRP